MKPSLIAYVQHWHMNQSDAFHDLLTEPMQPHASIEMRGWDGQSPVSSPEKGRNYVYCQLLPPTEWLQKIPQQLIWLPMWDEVRRYSQSWWNGLPKLMRIVAFSNVVYQRAKRAGLRTVRLKYYKNPQSLIPVNWSDRRVLLYWNRTGLLGPLFLERLCASLNIDKLLYRTQSDPGDTVRMTYELPRYLGKTEVEILPVFQTRQEYFDATRQANLFIAPRVAEGVGMTFLEAMARGCAVFAHNGATMNEYISSGENGYLFKSAWTIDRVLRAMYVQRGRYDITSYPSLEFVPRECDQNWREIASLDLERIGYLARQQQQLGYERWQQQIPQYAEFLSNINADY